MIQCGTFTYDSTNGNTVSLGSEIQFIIPKKINGAAAWEMYDIMRGMPVDAGSTVPMLAPNSSGAESAAGYPYHPTATGFKIDSGYYANGSVIVYLAIRRGPMKQPTSGTQVYNAIARTGTGAAATVTGVGFPPDLGIIAQRTHSNAPTSVWDRMRGATKGLYTDTTGGESTDAAAVTSFDMGGITVGLDVLVNMNTKTYINWFFRRYPGVFDEVAYTGTGSATTIAHNLGVAPELMIVKGRSSVSRFWLIYSSAIGAANGMYLNSNIAFTDMTAWNSTGPTSAVFTVSSSLQTNGSGENYVAYLFATKAGISKVGSYTGNGSSLTLDAGFTGGAKFIMIKRTDSTGDWYVWDSTRGIVAGNDPHLSLNTTAAEVTDDDSIDPDNSGFIVNQLAATNINVTDATYIYLAFSGDSI
ncbi:MAG: hypothetical protein ABIG99_02810 [Patescibacteria group bacterium]